MEHKSNYYTFRQVTNEEFCLFYNAISNFSKLAITPLQVSSEGSCFNFLCNAIEKDTTKATIVKIIKNLSGNGTVANITAL